MMPVSSAWELTFQVLTMPLFRIVSAIFLQTCSKIVAKCAREKAEKGPKAGAEQVQQLEDDDVDDVDYDDETSEENEND